MALSLRVVSSARSWSAARNSCWCDRSPLSAATIACSIGPVAHSRPSASFLIAAERIVHAWSAADGHPAGPPARREVRFRERRKGDDRGVRIARGNRRNRTIEREIGVDLVGEQGKVVAIGQLDKRAAGIDRIGGAGRVVRVDDDQGAGRRGDQAPYMIEVGHPAAIGVGAIKHRACADLGEDGCVQWISRYRDQHLVASFGERGQRQLNSLRRSRRDDDAIGRNRHAPSAALGRDRFARSQDTVRRRVAILARSDRPVDRFYQVRRCLEAEGNGIADVEVADPPPGSLNLSGFGHDIADCVDEPAYS